MMDAIAVKAEMNRKGAERKPFLFGVDFEMAEGFFVEDPFSSSEILFEIKGNGNAGREEGAPAGNPSLQAGVCSRQAYYRKFGTIREGLLRGDSFLANLTERTPIETDWSLEQIFRRSRAPYKLCLPGRFVCFSPECFVRAGEGKIRTYPMKGTIDATIENAEALLMDDYKETCEHRTIVDLLRNDLNSVAANVRVERFRYIDRIRTCRGELLQTSSEICGDLPDGWHRRVGDIIFRLLPAGSVSGAPKQATLDLIRRAEQLPRGFYTGVFGLFDGHSLDSAVMIRYIEQEDRQLFFRSGGGITINSRAEEEYLEVAEKIYIPVEASGDGK